MFGTNDISIGIRAPIFLRRLEMQALLVREKAARLLAVSGILTPTDLAGKTSLELNSGQCLQGASVRTRRPTFDDRCQERGEVSEGFTVFDSPELGLDHPGMFYMIVNY